MQIHVCSLQRDRSPYLAEWIQFHSLQGVSHFYLYLHHAGDDLDLARLLQKSYPITIYRVDLNLYQPQLGAFQHCLDHHGHEFDWCAFIDSDEFIYDLGGRSLAQAIQPYHYQDLSALAIYWQVFGTSGHVLEPRGRITEQFRWRADRSHWLNRHFKSLVRGHQGSSAKVSNGSHWFHTIMGTKDTAMRPIEQALRTDSGHVLSPWPADHSSLVINHYATQSLEYWLKVKQHQGSADQWGHERRTWQWFRDYDQNAVWDQGLDFMKDRW